MRTLLVIISFVISFNSYAQKPNISFKATEQANVWLGKEWNFKWTEMKSPLNVEFNGDFLNIYYDSGKIFDKVDVISFEKKEVKNNYTSKVEGHTYELETRNEKTQVIEYIILRTKLYGYKEGIESYTLEIPFYSKDEKKLYSYWYYQGWTE